MYLSPVMPVQASLSPPNACDIYEPIRLVLQLLCTMSPWIAFRLLLLLCVLYLQGDCESPENWGCLFCLCLPGTQVNVFLVNIKQATDIGCRKCPNGWWCQECFFGAPPRMLCHMLICTWSHLILDNPLRWIRWVPILEMEHLRLKEIAFLAEKMQPRSDGPSIWMQADWPKASAFSWLYLQPLVQCT